ncbi:MAG TPA: hypothetical protein DD438_11490 [Verrucomicrobiales bacterium]|nr:hypothetical protein [Verrucomicrobiales bacterium]HCQ37520.1 hypothetical protein [Verrucomicrobiales bacterium]
MRPIGWAVRCSSSGFKYLLIFLGSCGSANPVEPTCSPRKHRADGTAPAERSLFGNSAMVRGDKNSSVVFF